MVHQPGYNIVGVNIPLILLLRTVPPSSLRLTLCLACNGDDAGLLESLLSSLKHGGSGLYESLLSPLKRGGSIFAGGGRGAGPIRCYQAVSLHSSMPYSNQYRTNGPVTPHM